MTLPPSPTPAASEKAPVPTLIIRPPKKWVPVGFHEQRMEQYYVDIV